MKKSSLCAIALIIFSFIYSCSDSPSDPTPVSGKVVLKGAITLPDGNTPLANAAVFIPEISNAAHKIISLDTNGCSEPAIPTLAYTCTAADGSFSLEIETENSSVTVTIVSGEFTFSQVVDLTSETIDLGKVEMPVGDGLNTKIAVVTGTFDRMQDVLAKSGFGDIQDGHLVLGTEKFQLYDGDYTLQNNYPELDALFEDSNSDGQVDALGYDIIFINCGATEESLPDKSFAQVRSHTAHNHQNIHLSDEAKAVLKTFVENGGTLYATDWAYDFAEQIFPSYINFLGSEDIPDNQPEVHGEAEWGKSSEAFNATILQGALSSWLPNVTCSGQQSCLNQDGSITIEGFLPGWAVMEGLHDGAQGIMWIEGQVSYYYNGSNHTTVKPLMASFHVGSGKVIYTSFHTAEIPVAGFRPQERVLQYLVFD